MRAWLVLVALITGLLTAVPTAPLVAAQPAPPAPGQRAPSGLQGVIFLDSNEDGEVGETEPGLSGIEVILVTPVATAWTIRTDTRGGFTFQGLAPGAYHVSISGGDGLPFTTEAEWDVDVEPGAMSQVAFGLAPAVAAPPPEVAETPEPDAAVEQPFFEAYDVPTTEAMLLGEPENGSSGDHAMALSSVSALPLRFAQGRDLLAQVQPRIVGDGVVWLGVPFRSQIDGGVFQFVNCGPASLTMVLAGFGLEVGSSQVRDYLNALIDNYDVDMGTSLDVLAYIGNQAGLTPMDLYSERGGYRAWSTEAMRWHIQQGHPVITLVKYRNLPGHGTSMSDFDHYIVITGVTPDGFIYNDGAYASTLGYGLEITDVELEVAWGSSSIPRYAVAMGLSPDRRALSFPEIRKPPVVEEPPPPEPAPATGYSRRAEEADAPDQPVLLYVPPVPEIVVVPSPPPVEPVLEEEPVYDGPLTPMGLLLEPTSDPTTEATPGPGRLVPLLLSALAAGWFLLAAWSVAGRMLRLRARAATR